MEKKNEVFSLLYPEGYTNEDKEQHQMKNYDFIQALTIDDMIILPKSEYLGGTSDLSGYFTTDTKVLRYRLDIVSDLVEHKETYDIFMKAIPIIQNISELRKIMSRDFTVESSLSSIRILEMYEEIVDLFYDGLKNCTFQSEGMRRFQKKLQEIAEGEEYRNLKSDLGKMQVDFGALKSVTVGINLDEMLQAKEAGVISINREPFRSGDLMVKLLKKKKDSFLGLTPMIGLGRNLHQGESASVNQSIQIALTSIFHKAIRQFEPLVQKYFAASTAFFVQLLDDIRFLTSGVKFIYEMREMGFDMCKPEVAEIEEKKCDLKQVYNPKLARSMVEKTIVSNEFTFDDRGRFYLVTGPNHGGKSIFAYSIGMAQAIFQLGLYVPAASALMSPVTGIFTHFPTNDEDNFGKGRLESECARLSEILKELSDTDMLLMDESFSSTSGLEAGYIASEVLTGIGVIGCGGIYVTHIHDLSMQVGDYNAHSQNKGKIDNLVAVMKDSDHGIRSYHVMRTVPDGLSYAKDIAGLYGLNLESILKSHA